MLAVILTAINVKYFIDIDWYSYWYNQLKSNIKLNGERRRGFKQEKLIEHFFLCSHNGTHDQEVF